MWEEILKPSGKSVLLPSIFRDRASELDSEIRLDNAHCFTDESSRQRRQDNINVLQASLMGNHLIANVQLLLAT